MSAPMNEHQQPLIKAEGVAKTFQISGANIYAVDGVDLEIMPGEAVALVGESGSGKSTLGNCLVRLETTTVGRITFAGRDITAMRESEFRPLRRQIQMVFQDPKLSLNPRLSVRQTLIEPLKLHQVVPKNQMDEKLAELLSMVNIDPALLDRKPRELSGGQQQRVAIARAIATSPEFVVLDEPTSSLDMSIRIQIISLLRRLQRDLGIAYLFITHDLSTARRLCSRIVVMYLGRVMEVGPTEAVFNAPKHPYTKALLSAIPVPNPRVRKTRLMLPGETPSPNRKIVGCPLADRCPYVMPECRTEEIRLLPVGANGLHRTACLLYRDADAPAPWDRDDAGRSDAGNRHGAKTVAGPQKGGATAD